MTAAGGRPAYPRQTATIVLEVELGAVDHDDAEDRFRDLVAELRPRLERAVRNHRRGGPVLRGVDLVVAHRTEETNV